MRRLRKWMSVGLEEVREHKRRKAQEPPWPVDENGEPLPSIELRREEPMKAGEFLCFIHYGMSPKHFEPFGDRTERRRCIHEVLRAGGWRSRISDFQAAIFEHKWQYRYYSRRRSGDDCTATCVA